MQSVLDHMKAIYEYDASSGVFSRRKSGRGRLAGQSGGTLNDDGYVRIMVAGRRYGAHRLAWLVTYGEWPKGEIDHINGNRADNRIANLRDVSHSQNQRNLHRPRSDNRTGVLGVSWHAQTGKWRARLNDRHLGLYASAEEAGAAYQQARANNI
jgi:hypothetical protein